MNSDELLIIQYPYRMSQQRVDALREQILKQRESGVILLSDFCTVVTKPKDIDIQVELEKENKACPCWDCMHFSKEGMGYCTIHPDCYGDCACDDYAVEEPPIPYEKLNVGDTFKLFKSGDERVFRKEKEGAIQIRDSSGNRCEELGHMIYLYIGCLVYKEEYGSRTS